MARPYTDEDRGAALAVLVSHGGNLTTAAAAFGCSRSTMRRWRDESDEVIDQISHHKKAELDELFKNEIRAAFGDLPTKRIDASYRDVATAIGIFFDKTRLLAEESTAITEQRAVDLTPAESIAIARRLRVLQGGKERTA